MIVDNNLAFGKPSIFAVKWVEVLVFAILLYRQRTVQYLYTKYTRKWLMSGKKLDVFVSK